MSTPHASWARAYDAIYEASFGAFYQQLTELTLEGIRSIASPPASILDVGAGTGRLSVPLAASGYRVTAVEPCEEMLKQLQEKANREGVTVVQRCATIQGATDLAACDLALCVFTVTLYLLDDDALRSTCENLAAAVRPGGHLLIDVPRLVMFSSFEAAVPGGLRSVTIRPDDRNDSYLYEENTRIRIDGQEHACHDRFPIRYWRTERVLEELAAVDFCLESDWSARFAGSGSEYFLLRRL